MSTEMKDTARPRRLSPPNSESAVSSKTSHGLTDALESKLDHPMRSAEFDLHAGTNDVLRDVQLTAADSGGALTFYGQDPILQTPLRFGTMAAIGLAARSVAVAALWRHATSEGQDI